MLPVEHPIIDDQAPQGGGPTRDILGAGNHLNVHTKVGCMKGGEGYDCCISHEGNISLMNHPAQYLQIGHLHLGVGDHLHEEGTAVFIEMCLHVYGIGQITKTNLHAKRTQRIHKKRVGVTEQMT